MDRAPAIRHRVDGGPASQSAPRNHGDRASVGFVAVLFYVITIVKVGPGVLQPMR